MSAIAQLASPVPQHHSLQRQRQKVATASPAFRILCLLSITFGG